MLRTSSRATCFEYTGSRMSAAMAVGVAVATGKRCSSCGSWRRTAFAAVADADAFERVAAVVVDASGG